MKNAFPPNRILGLFAGVALALVPGVGWADDVTWVGGEMTWTPSGDTSFDPAYNDGDNVYFTGDEPGDITVDAGGVDPGIFDLSDGTYNFLGGAIRASEFWLSGGVLQWNASNQLGTGTIHVTDDATIEAMSTGGPLTMSNAIEVSDGAKVTIKQRNNNSNSPSSPTVGAISGGTVENPIEVEFNNSGVNGQIWQLSSSTFVGNVTISTPAGNAPITLLNYQNDQFGDASNELYFVGGGGLLIGGIPAGGESDFDRNTHFEGSTNHAFGASGGTSRRLIVNGKVTQETTGNGVIYVGGTLRFTNEENQISRLQINNSTLELTYLSSHVMNVDFAGAGRIRIVGDLVGETSLKIRSITTASSEVEIQSAAAEITLTETNPIYADSTSAGPIVKLGAGTLIVTGNSSGTSSNQGFRGGKLHVNEGRMYINSAIFDNIGSLVVNGGIFGGSGRITFVQDSGITVNSGGTLAPGASVESLVLGGYTGVTAIGVTLNDGATFAYEVDSSVDPSVGADLLTIGSAAVTGDLTLDGEVTLTIADLADTPVAFELGTTFSLINYTGDWNGGLFTFNGTLLTNGFEFSDGLNVWKIQYDAEAGGLNFVGDQVAGHFVNITAVPEPTVAALFLGSLGAWLLPRRRKGQTSR